MPARPCFFASLALLTFACGSGPTEGPKSIDPGIQVGGVPGSTTAKIPQEQAQDVVPSRSRPTNGSAKRAAADDKPPPEDGAMAAGGASSVMDDATDTPDPLKGQFTLAQAAIGLPEKGGFEAKIRTSRGELKCKLYDDKAPVATANFVGLARGVRPFKERNKWVTRAAYDGTLFHRVIKGFMIQGGDPLGTGRGEPGYVFKDELWAGGKHDRPGLLCMANRGPDTNGMQFFITDQAAPHLDKSYTIFGECSPASTVHAIAQVPVDATDRPEKDVVIEKVEISRGGVVAPPPAPGKTAPATELKN